MRARPPGVPSERKVACSPLRFAPARRLRPVPVLSPLSAADALALAKRGYVTRAPLLPPELADALPFEINRLIGEGLLLAAPDRIVDGQPTEWVSNLGTVWGADPDGEILTAIPLAPPALRRARGVRGQLRRGPNVGAPRRGGPARGSPDRPVRHGASSSTAWLGRRWPRGPACTCTRTRPGSPAPCARSGPVRCGTPRCGPAR